MPQVQSFQVWGLSFQAVVLRKTAEGQPQQAIMATFGTETYCKCVVVVDEDVDIFNLADVLKRVRARPCARFLLCSSVQ